MKVRLFTELPPLLTTGVAGRDRDNKTWTIQTPRCAPFIIRRKKSLGII